MTNNTREGDPMSTLNIPVPTISTGPKHMTDTEAAEHYLREMRDRTKMLQAGSGVTALVDRLLDDVLDAMEALNTSADTPRPERVTLTDEEREELYVSRFSFRYDYRTAFPPDGQRAAYVEGDLHAAVEQILTDRRAAWGAAVRAQIKADLLAEADECLPALDKDRHLHPEWRIALRSRRAAYRNAARIAGGEGQ